MEGISAAIETVARAAHDVELGVTPPSIEECGGDRIEWLRRMSVWTNSDPDGKRWSEARDRLARRKEREAEDAEAQRRAIEADRRAVAMERDPKIKGRTFGTFKARTDAQRHAQRVTQGWVSRVVGDDVWSDGPKRVLGLVGPVGVGKTHLLCAVAVDFVRRAGGTAMVVSANDMLAKMNPYNHTERGGSEAFIREAQTVDLLLIDDWGAKTSDLTASQVDGLFRIFDARTDAKGWTAFSSNKPNTEDSLGTKDVTLKVDVERIISRIRQSHVLVAVGGEWVGGKWQRSIPDQRRAA